MSISPSALIRIISTLTIAALPLETSLSLEASLPLEASLIVPSLVSRLTRVPTLSQHTDSYMAEVLTISDNWNGFSLRDSRGTESP
jgi:hypothetical protein